MNMIQDTRPSIASSSGHLREKMPGVTAWIDSLREAFGKEMVDKMIRTGLRDGTFWAVENGLVVVLSLNFGWRPRKGLFRSYPPTTGVRNSPAVRGPAGRRSALVWLACQRSRQFWEAQ